MSDLKISSNSLQNAILLDGQFVCGCAFADMYGDNVYDGSIESKSFGSFSHGYVKGGIINASGNGAHAEGFVENELIQYSSNENRSVFEEYHIGKIISNSSGSHAEGYAYGGIICASGNGSHAEGYNTKALNHAAHAEGEGYYEIKDAYYNGEQISETVEKYNHHAFIYTGKRELSDGYFIFYYIKDTSINLICQIKVLLIDDINHRTIFTTSNPQDFDILEEYVNNDKQYLYLTPTRPEQYKLYDNTKGATGYASHTEGIATLADASAAHASGIGTIAYHEAMTAIGKYNSIDDLNGNVLFAIGNGDNLNNRSNIMTVIGSKNPGIYFNQYKVYLGDCNNSSCYISAGTPPFSNISDLLIRAIDSSIILDASSIKINGPIINTVKAQVNNVANVELGMPIGSIIMWAGNIEPEGWLICDGRYIPTEDNTLYSTAYSGFGDYQNLINVLGIKYGKAYKNSNEPWGPDKISVINENLSNDANHAIQIPNFRLKFPLGAGPSTLSMDILDINYSFSAGQQTYWSYNGSTGGEAGHILTSDEMKGHTHYINSTARIDVGSDIDVINANGISYAKSISGTESSSHNNIPPYLAINYIIKYK